jgi:hypothetical protein
MSIQSDKDRFLKECEEMMRVEKVIIKKIEESDVRGQHHAEEAYCAFENLKTVIAGTKPDDIIYLKSHAGFGSLENALGKAKEMLKNQKNFYVKQMQQAEDVGEYGGKIANIMKSCNDLLLRCENSLKNQEKILENFKRV